MSFRPNGDIIMGGMRDIVPSKQEYEDDDSTMNLTVSQGLRKFMREIVHVPSVDKEWVGVMGFSRDRLPIVGNLKPVLGDKEGSNQYIAAGFTGHGKCRKVHITIHMLTLCVCTYRYATYFPLWSCSRSNAS